MGSAVQPTRVRTFERVAEDYLAMLMDPQKRRCRSIGKAPAKVGW